MSNKLKELIDTYGKDKVKQAIEKMEDIYSKKEKET